MPHFGQVPGPSRTTSGCIGQVYFTASVVGGIGGWGGSGVVAPPQHECPSGFAAGAVYFAGSASNFSRQCRLQKW
jgi:hypothetical protein